MEGGGFVRKFRVGREHLQEGRASARPQRPGRGARPAPQRAWALLRSATAATKRGPPGCALASRISSQSGRSTCPRRRTRLNCRAKPVRE